MTALGWLLRLGLGGLFLVAGVLKLDDPVAFAVEITNYRLGAALAPYLAPTLPVIEIVAGLALVAGPRPWRHAAALLIAGMMAVFTVAVTAAVVRGINIDCGCFGGGSGPVTWGTVARDLVLLAGATTLLWVQRRELRR